METVVITGANRGIGLELCKLFDRGGSRVVAGCREPDGAKALRQALQSAGSSVHRLDVSDGESIAAFVAALADQTVDVLVNNAGVLEDH